MATSVSTNLFNLFKSHEFFSSYNKICVIIAKYLCFHQPIKLWLNLKVAIF